MSNNTSERTRSERKPRYPRLEIQGLRRKIDEDLMAMDFNDEETYLR